MSMLDQLLEMGFKHDLAEKALKETHEAGLIEAMDWLSAHQDKQEIISDSTAKNIDSVGGSTVELVEDEPTGTSSVTSTAHDQTFAQSYKCDDCGKLLIDDNAVMFHAARTKHENFSESTDIVKPLSEEEKAKRLESLHQKLKEAREKKEKEEAREAIEKEKRRRMEGQSLAKMQEEIREKEMKKIAEERRRQKKEDELARKRVLEQIRMDREARKAAEIPPPAQANVSSQPPSSPSVSIKSSENCMLHIRLPDGTVMKETFKSNEPLSAVRLWIEMHGNESVANIGRFTLMSPFPRQIFSLEDMEKPLFVLGLVPSANLVVTKIAAV
ncbi:hypothetical protein AB6A40_001591 [Gnathostoma spinigerum]|uniref:UBX domain-containing protein 1 n=1 Tax=Gnathostoma spinigerum TaxID=75299 RepID=A0ABD6EDW2_9BILA